MDDETEDSDFQYEVKGNRFFPTGKSVQTLPSGFYDVVYERGYGLESKNFTVDELIDLEGTIADEIFSDLDSFLKMQDRFQTFGLTHKRGYLLYGPPGTGKSSLAIMVARRFLRVTGGLTVFASNDERFINAVEIIRKIEPGRPTIYILEEADEMLDNANCLAILDGESSVAGAIFIALTNHKERMPPRIANRPGRFDRVLKVECPDPIIQVEYLRKICQRGSSIGLDVDVPEQIVHALKGISLSMAHLKEAFIAHVLMGTPLSVVRDRFKDMAEILNDDEIASNRCKRIDEDALIIEDAQAEDLASTAQGFIGGQEA